jgi:hypothetical protein
MGNFSERHASNGTTTSLVGLTQKSKNFETLIKHI